MNNICITLHALTTVVPLTIPYISMVQLIKDLNATKAQCALYTIVFTGVVRVLSQVTWRMRDNQGDLT